MFLLIPLFYFIGGPSGSSIIPGRDVSPFASVRTVPVFIVEDLRVPSIIPSEPELPILVENDEDPPISFGYEESEELRRKLWIEKRPHRVYVRDRRAGSEIGMGGVQYALGDRGRNSGSEGGSEGEWGLEPERSGLRVAQGSDGGSGLGARRGEGVYSSVAAALSEAFSIASGRFTRMGDSQVDPRTLV